MNKDFKPIETRYKGHLFRSRLEARWAVFFDTLGVKYEYEFEGFKMGDTYYLPDFFLPDLHYWIEIKGQEPNQRDWEKCSLFQSQSKDPLYLLIGSPGLNTSLNSWPNFTASYTGIGLKNKERREGYVWVRCLQCKAIGLSPDYHHFTPMDILEMFCQCHKRYMNTPIWGGNHSERLGDHIKHDVIGNIDDKKLMDAYTAARQARFEHGEQGPR